MYGSARSVGRGDTNHSGGRDGSGTGNQGSGRSPRLPRSPRMGHRRTNSTGGSGGGPGGAGGKTLSMENIQSLNAAYATSGPMYLSDNEVAMGGDHLPKTGGTVTTMGRQRVTYGSRGSSSGVVAASTPNISTTVPANAVLPAGMMAGDALAFGDHHMASTVPHSLRQARDNTILDLQAQLKEVLRENEMLRREVEVKESKLSSSMNSIKTFWSPELKKERALRKDEASKIAVWKEQYRVIQDEAQHLQMTVQALQDELRIQRDLNQLLQQDPASQGRDLALTSEPTEENYRRLQGEHERQAKELFLLRKTLEEMELRIDTQKQTLAARDESIKKLLEMLQSKATLKFKLASEVSKAATQRDRIQHLQNELIWKNDSEQELLKLRRVLQQEQKDLQHHQSHLAKMATLEATVKQQGEVIEKMEKALDGKLRDKNSHRGDKRLMLMERDGLKNKEMKSALAAENARLRKELERIHQLPAPIKTQQSDQEEWSLQHKLERTEARIQTLEAQLEENAKVWGREKQEMLTKLSEHRHGFIQTSKAILQNVPSVSQASLFVP